MNIIESLEKNPFINQMPGMFAVLDLDCKFLFFNKTTIQWTGFKSLESLIGLSYADMPCRVAEQHAILVQHDHQVIQTDGPVSVMGYYCYANNERRVVLGEKYPFRDETGKMIATVAQFQNITHHNIIAKLFDIGLVAHKIQTITDQPSYTLADHYPELPLSERQSECLFHLIRGKTSKEIARILALSFRTIEHYIDQIKIKLNCDNKAALIEKAITMGYVNIIPRSLLTKL